MKIPETIVDPTAVQKALMLLLAISHEQREVGTTELANKMGMHKATVSRILIELAECGFVYKNKSTRKYWLGPAVHQLGMTMAETNFKQIVQLARVHIEQLRDAVHETVALEIWLGNSTVTTHFALGDKTLRATPPGELLAPHAAAGAKAILAYTHEERVDSLLQGDLLKITENTMTDKEEVKLKLLEYLKQGYAIDYQEMHMGICAIAVPIFDQIKQPIAALAILMPIDRSDQLESPLVIANLKARAQQISRELAANHVRRSNWSA